MAHDVFISYSNRDKPIADGICANLEAVGVRCWIAPRDIAPGDDWPTAITRAISQSRIMVLVFSAHSNSSEDVSRELILAANSKLVIVPFKIENIEPEPGKQYYLARTHWLDAINPPTREQIHALIECVQALIPVREPIPIAEVKPAIAPIPVIESPKARPTPKKKAAWLRFLWIAGLLLVLLCLAGFYVLTFVTHTIAIPGAPSATLTATPRPKATPKFPGTPTATLDLRAKVGVYGINLYQGPGNNYSKVDFVYADYVTIIGEAYHCAWFEVTAKSGSGLEYGWVNAGEVTYQIECSKIKSAAIPTP